MKITVSIYYIDKVKIEAWGGIGLNKKIAIFWPGDYRAYPNEAALPMVERVSAQMEAALRRLGRSPYRVE
jgi:hypothetical protein